MGGGDRVMSSPAKQWNDDRGCLQQGANHYHSESNHGAATLCEQGLLKRRIVIPVGCADRASLIIGYDPRRARCMCFRRRGRVFCCQRQVH